MKTVFVGLSGGVDSATAAYLLKKEGYKVVGAFIKGWEPDFLPCTGKEDRQEAMRVAAYLQIPFVTYNLGEEYKREVVDYFIAEYKAGRTPNPDVICNRAIKFGTFWEKAKADGADFIATGHYAQTDGKDLRVSKDAEKDQTYFLWTLTQNDLLHSLFPVGAYEKNEVRAIAEKAGLPNAKRRDSQGLCFLGHVDMKAFLSRYISEKKGAIVNESGSVLGQHDGVWFYTLGQHVSLGGTDARHYVTGKDVQKNIITVSKKPLGGYTKNTFSIHRENWISGMTPTESVLMRYRYRQPLMRVELKGSEVLCPEPQLVALGQSAVFYTENGSVLGGGIIGG